MIGKKRLDNLQKCRETVIGENIPGDFIEPGIWRGGACIFMREDTGFDISRDVSPVLAVSPEIVQALFRRYGLLDEKVQFLKAWFKDSLPNAPIGQLAILRLDGICTS